MATFSVQLASDFVLDVVKTKKSWNFVKGDLAKIFASLGFGSNAQVSLAEDRSYVLDIQANNAVKTITFSYDLSLLDCLEIDGEDLNFSAVILACVIRLQHSYCKAFKIYCDSYPVVQNAVQILANTLNFKVTNNWLCSFMDYPVPGRKPIKEKKLSSQEVSARYADKRRLRGEIQMKTWIKQDLKDQLGLYCQTRGCTLESALSEIIPLGLNIGTYLNRQKQST